MSRRLEGKLEPAAGNCCAGPSQGRRGGERIQLLLPEHSSGFLQTFQVPALSLQLFPEIHMQIGCVPFTPKFVVKSLSWCSSVMHLRTYGIITSRLENNSPKSPASNRNSPLSLLALAWESHHEGNCTLRVHSKYWEFLINIPRGNFFPIVPESRFFAYQSRLPWRLSKCCCFLICD